MPVTNEWRLTKQRSFLLIDHTVVNFKKLYDVHRIQFSIRSDTCEVWSNIKSIDQFSRNPKLEEESTKLALYASAQLIWWCPNII